MSAGDDSASREHDPTERKLDEARRKGDLPRGRDLFAAAAYGGLLLAFHVFGPEAVDGFGRAASVLLAQADRMAPVVTAGGAGGLAGYLAQIGSGLLALFLLPMLAVAGMIVAQRALVFSPDKLMPKLSRISPMQGAKNKFGLSGLVDFAKSFVKLLAIAAVLGIFLTARSDLLLATIRLEPAGAITVLLRLLLEFLLIVLVVQIAVGLADLLWQRHDFLRRNRMSRRELLDELKSSDGDPHMKARRRQRAVEIASDRMLADVALADVVLVNPTHYAVALRWDRAGGGAPSCVAKGMDAVAARIRAAAAEAGVPVRHDPPTTRLLYATVDLGQQIRPEHYRAVAAAIRFADRMRARAAGASRTSARRAAARDAANNGQGR